MKLPISDIHTETNLNTKEYQFKIDENDQGIIFEMLRSKIYKDPIGSICREIASNARDAHRESMKPNIPIEITIHERNIMNDGSMTIEFKDHGTGISEDRMENIFCKYAASTKRDTNKMTGGFGLGAKTPFSYSDVFFIKTVYDKFLYTYTAYIDESKKGKITLHKKVNSEELNSTSIVVPIKNEADRSRFEEACYLFTNYWKIEPIFKNFKSKKEYNIDKVLYEKDNYKLISKTNRHQGPIALIDGIPYTIDTNADSMFNRQLGYNTMVTVMTFKNGELDISINRETLQYTKKTTNSLNKRFKAIQKDFQEFLKDYIKTSEHYLEACYKMYTMDRTNDRNDSTCIYSWLGFYIGKVSAEFKGVKTTNYFNIENMRFSKYRLAGDEVYSERIQGSHIEELYNNDLYLLSEGKGTVGVINLEILKTHCAPSGNKSFIVLGLKPYNKRKLSAHATPHAISEYKRNKESFEAKIKDEYKLVTETLGKKIIDYSSIKTTKVAGERSLPVSTHVKCFGKGKWNAPYDWQPLIFTKKDIIADNKKYVYIIVDKAGEHDQVKLTKVMDLFIAATYNNKKLIFITKRQAKYFDEYTKAEDLLKTVDKDFLNNYVDFLKLKDLIRTYNNTYIQYDFKVSSINSIINTARDNYKKFKDDSKIINLRNSSSVVSEHIKLRPSAYVLEFEKTINDIPVRYPLFNGLNRWDSDKKVTEEVNFYIKCKEKEL